MPVRVVNNEIPLKNSFWTEIHDYAKFYEKKREYEKKIDACQNDEEKG
jgi:hypothetical protein